MLSIFRNIKLVQKLSGMAALMTIPVALLAFLFIQAKNTEIAHMRKQVDTLDYLSPVHKLQQYVLLHRGLAYIVVSDSTYRPQLAAGEAEIETALSALQRIDSQFGKTFGTTEAVTVQSRIT